MKASDFDYTQHLDLLIPLLKEIEQSEKLSALALSKLVRKYALDNGNVFSKDQLVMAYRKLVGTHGLADSSEKTLAKIRMKPIRTSSGVTPVTVLTKPFPCPGKCIFCPSDVRMPKSYLSDEPGAQRAERNYFDPYLQTYNRLKALYEIGHNIDKVELIVLGGTWSYYPEPYQIWFIKECFRALNNFAHFVESDSTSQVKEVENIVNKYEHVFSQLNRSSDPSINSSQLSVVRSQKAVEEGSTYNKVISQEYVAPERKVGLDSYQSATWAELEHEHEVNEKVKSRCVGLVIETRPDNISEEEVMRIRRLGCTKTQIGIQSLNDDVLAKNHRGHDVAATKRAFKLLRQAGFKVHGHWMANLYGSSVDGDKKDYDKLFNDLNFRPDELKIYPCSLIQSAELMDYYEDGRWKPYTHEELLDVLTHVLKKTPPYCRLTRVIRDIPSTDIVVGNKKTNFRQIVEQKLAKAGEESVDIRAREIRNSQFQMSNVKLEEIEYETSSSREIFLQFTTQVVGSRQQAVGKILAFLRLSLPTAEAYIDELKDSAIIREVHVYGPAVGIGKSGKGKAQHGGFGTQLIERAKEIAKEKGYGKLAVISGIGTREYYRKKGFEDGQLYQYIELV